MPHKRSRKVHISEEGVPQNSADMLDWLDDQLELFADGPAIITIQRPKRSLAQNRLLWGVVYPAVHEGLKDAGVHDLHLMGPDGELMELPITVNLIHMVMKRRHLTPDEPGEEPTTTTLSTTEMSDYIRAIRHDPLVEKYEIYVPMPNSPPPEAYENSPAK